MEKEVTMEKESRESEENSIRLMVVDRNSGEELREKHHR
jgi:hypothetical protein